MIKKTFISGLFHDKFPAAIYLQILLSPTTCELLFLGALLRKTKFNLLKWYLHPSFLVPKTLT